MCSAILTALNRWTNESSGKFLAGPIFIAVPNFLALNFNHRTM
jgi:hypothetical protein